MIKIGTPATVQNESYDKFIGYTPATVVAINPTATEIEKLGFNKPAEEPVYTSEDETTHTPQARIEFWFKIKVNGEDKYIRKNIFIKKQSAKTKDTLRTQIIDKYGNTCWLTKEQFDNKQQPDYGRLVGTEWRVAYQGEEALTDIIRNWLNIPVSFQWDKTQSKYVNKENAELENAELRIETIADFVDWQHVENTCSRMENILILSKQ